MADQEDQNQPNAETEVPQQPDVEPQLEQQETPADESNNQAEETQQAEEVVQQDNSGEEKTEKQETPGDELNNQAEETQKAEEVTQQENAAEEQAQQQETPADESNNQAEEEAQQENAVEEQTQLQETPAGESNNQADEVTQQENAAEEQAQQQETPADVSNNQAEEAEQAQEEAQQENDGEEKDEVKENTQDETQEVKAEEGEEKPDETVEQAAQEGQADENVAEGETEPEQAKEETNEPEVTETEGPNEDKPAEPEGEAAQPSAEVEGDTAPPAEGDEPETGAVVVEPENVPSETTAAPVEQETVPATEKEESSEAVAVEAGAAPEKEAEVNQEEQPEEEDAGKVSPVQVETTVREKTPQSPKVPIEEDSKGPRVNLNATATVKFVLMPSGQVVTLACTLGQTLESLKTHFAAELKMSSSLIMMMFDGKNMQDSTTLADLGVGPNGTVQLEMQSADPVNTPLKQYRPRQEYHMPDVITVRVMTEDGESKDVVVEIERSRSKKPFLGGWRNKTSGSEFHNAAAQTVKKPRPPPTVERFCRDTQTCEQKNVRQQTTNTASTQMTGIGVYVTNMEDKLVTPGKYFSADEHWDLILRNVIILQKYYRRWLAKRYVTKLKEDKAKRLEWERQEELRKKREKEERIKRDYARRLNPKTKADFDMLLNCLEKWRQEEMERINSTLFGAERKAALCMLLDQETELLSAIERHKNEANKDNRDNRIMAFLEKAAAPKKWQGHDGNLTYMDTPFTIRAKELRDIYNSINMKYLTQDERLDVLLTLKHTVKEHDCKLTQEIIELIDREADLLMRGVKEGNLTGLRKRISTLFLQYIKTPTFNPEAARLLKVPQDPSTLRKNINYCHSCGRYLPSTEFFITSNSKQVGRCRNCMKVENDGRQREDYTFYRVMLKALRKTEEAMQDGSSICYLLQENDLRYLVENIWSNQSVLSAWDDLYDLVLVRWDKHQEWSPWNCILLTHDEAEAHQKLFSLEEGYGQVFIHKVTQKHNFARNYFSRLPGMAELLRQKVGNRDLVNNKNGPSVAGHTVAKAQKV